MSGPKQPVEFPLVAFILVLLLVAGLIAADLKEDTVPDEPMPSIPGQVEP